MKRTEYKPKRVIQGVFLLALFFFASNSGASITVPVNEDAATYSYWTAGGFGPSVATARSMSVQVYDFGEKSYAWFKFNLPEISEGLIVNSAKFYGYVWWHTDTLDLGYEVGSYYVYDDSWHEALFFADPRGITWNSQPTDFDASYTDSVLVDNHPQWYSWDVTSAVQDSYQNDRIVSLLFKFTLDTYSDTIVGSGYANIAFPWGLKTNSYLSLTLIPAPGKPPIASFTYSPANPVVGEEITFDASSSYDVDGTIERYKWDFGDGGSGGDREGTHTHTYSKAGSYTVTLTVKDNDGLENLEPERRNVIVVEPIIYVDDDAPADPCWYNPAISDPDEDGTAEHPFDMIQEGIDAALDGETVIVRYGTYWEAIEFAGRNITVTGFDPNEPNAILPYPVIDANYTGTAVTFRNEEEPNCILEGFVITRGAGEVAGGINCMGSSPTISHCLIVGNRVMGPNGGGGAVFCIDSNAVFENCTFSGNYGGEQGAGLYLCDSNAVLLNCIVWDNLPYQIAVACGLDPNITFSDVQGGWPGQGNIDIAPYFAELGYWADANDPNIAVEPSEANAVWVGGDYHLKSQAGRWEPYRASWLIDDVTSLCIDAGDPNSDWTAELWPHGERINMGAYGGTPQASMSLSIVADPLSEALDTSLSFTTGGDADWFGQTTTFYYGGDAAQSEDISHRQDSWMQTMVSGAGTVKFYWKVSSEGGYDYLKFYIDGELQDRISGTVDWRQMTYTISASGPHTLEWRYTKDRSISSGSDCGWVDKVEWGS